MSVISGFYYLPTQARQTLVTANPFVFSLNHVEAEHVLHLNQYVLSGQATKTPIFMQFLQTSAVPSYIYFFS
jgi:hypothetical protein